MRTNVKGPTTYRTHEGAPAIRLTTEQELRRSVLACLLWEQQFYEDGEEIAERIVRLAREINPLRLGHLAIEAREQQHLRHVPLLLVRELARHPHRRTLPNGFLADVVQLVLRRADEPGELIKLCLDGGFPNTLSRPLKTGIATAMQRFDEYELAKYNRPGAAIGLRNVLAMTHPKPINEEQNALWKRLHAGELKTPDTWEVALSAGKNKRETWERLLRENKLGGLALLRNLRNMLDARVDEVLVRQSIRNHRFARVLPFRFIAAANHAPRFESELETALLRTLAEVPKLPGKTVILVDVSGSMADLLSHKSELTRMDAACGVAMVLRELCEEPLVYSFSEHIVEVPPRRGFALRDTIVTSQRHWSTYLGRAVNVASSHRPDRIVAITDEQSHDGVESPSGRGYMINVASGDKSVGYGDWTRITGWSEAVVKYIQAADLRKDRQDWVEQCPPSEAGA